MIIDIITLFPGMFTGPFAESMIKRAADAGLVRIALHNLRDYSKDKHRKVDDTPYGGGPGMVLKPEPVFEAVRRVKKKGSAKVILLSPQGRPFNQKLASDLSKEKRLIFVCGHYEGFDERIPEGLKALEISIGDYVLTGGEIPAMVIIDSVVRLIPGVVGDSRSVEHESFSGQWLDFPQYTRPSVYRKRWVPDVLMGGNHARIEEWRKKESIRKTLERRPEIIDNNKLTHQEKILYETVLREVTHHGHGKRHRKVSVKKNGSRI